jgi:hypothetical protein
MAIIGIAASDPLGHIEHERRKLLTVLTGFVERLLDMWTPGRIAPLWIAFAAAISLDAALKSMPFSPLECGVWGTMGLVIGTLALVTEKRERAAHGTKTADLQERLLRREVFHTRAFTSLGDITRHIVQQVETATMGSREPAIAALRAELRHLRTEMFFGQLAIVDVECRSSATGEYKLKAYVCIENCTGEEIRVSPPMRWQGARLHRPQPGRIASTLQLQNLDGTWEESTTQELTVPAGRVFSFWLGFDPSLELDGLRALRSGNRLGTFTLPVSIADWQYEWTREL